MEEWIGPAIIAAVISSLVGVIGWFVTYRQAIDLEQHRRVEKIVDFQIAIHAEIRSILHDLQSIDIENQLREIERRYAESSAYSVTVPRHAENVVFTAIVGDIHILPGTVIDPVILFHRQQLTLMRFIEDLRSDDFRKKPAAVQLEMYGDYLRLRAFLGRLAERAMGAIRASLEQNGVSIPVEDRSVHRSASAE